jgi:hypothetical protein
MIFIKDLKKKSAENELKRNNKKNKIRKTLPFVFFV